MAASKRWPYAELIVMAFGCGLIAVAIAANQTWLDHHFLPSFWTPREEVVRAEEVVRVCVALIGAIVALVLRRPLAHFFAREPLYLLTIPLAVLLAIVTTEIVLRLRAPLGGNHVDAAAGWFKTAPTRHDHYLGDDISYALDRNGYRVESATSRIDFDVPTIVFTGESMMAGLKLQWADTIPAQASTLLDIQPANIAVPGFSSRDAYVRLHAELPKFRRPVAVVSLFAPALFDRNLDDDGEQPSRLTTIFRRVVPYRTEDEIDRGVEVTRDVLRKTVALAHSRGATPLIIVPEFGDEQPGEHELRRRILDEARLPYVRVMVDRDDRVENDGHPDADGARTIARAIAVALKESLPVLSKDDVE